ncbi:hypothetical protein C0995_000467 [Termitomyces sp. Mi166|nr:hypothetical protein C0995_000467 [Termitomyces sp. Mi166\
MPTRKYHLFLCLSILLIYHNRLFVQSVSIALSITALPALSADKTSLTSSISKNIPPIRLFSPSAFPALYRERGEAIEAEERDARLDTPIFVCQLSFPGMPTLLHFFEPRYRLMLRRCLESPNPSFGMVMPSKGGLSPHLDYGTMLEIRSVQMQPDGRSYVETWGTYRFRILEVGTLDGYMVGRIERIDDYPEDLTEGPAPATIASPSTAIMDPTEAGPSTTTQQATQVQEEVTEAEPTPHDVTIPSPEESTSAASQATTPAPSRNASPTPPPILLHNHPSNSVLMAQCRTFLDQLKRGTAPWIVQRLSSTYVMASTSNPHGSLTAINVRLTPIVTEHCDSNFGLGLLDDDLAEIKCQFPKSKSRDSLSIALGWPISDGVQSSSSGRAASSNRVHCYDAPHNRREDVNDKFFLCAIRV